jgi:hypothetical protein
MANQNPELWHSWLKRLITFHFFRGIAPCDRKAMPRRLRGSFPALIAMAAMAAMAAKWSTGFAGGAPGNRRVDVQQAAEEERLNNVEPKITVSTRYTVSVKHIWHKYPNYISISPVSVYQCVSVFLS